MKPLTTRQIWLARGLALGIDALQIGLLPLFAGGAAEGVDIAVDAVAAVLFLWLCGFHWAFLPTAVAELVPFVDLFPSWTAAVWFATRGKTRALPPSAERPALPPAPADSAR